MPRAPKAFEVPSSWMLVSSAELGADGTTHHVLHVVPRDGYAHHYENAGSSCPCRRRSHEVAFRAPFPAACPHTVVVHVPMSDRPRLVKSREANLLRANAELRAGLHTALNVIAAQRNGRGGDPDVELAIGQLQETRSGGIHGSSRGKAADGQGVQHA